jgi:hypothetical protein
MLNFRVRPRIRRFSTLPIETILAQFQAVLDKNEFPVKGRIVQQHVSIKLANKDQHFWSPELSIEVSENHLQDLFAEAKDKPTLVRGFVGPKSTVWTLFIFFYIAFGLLALFAAMWGGSQWMLDMPQTGFWYMSVALLTILVTFIGTQIGQRIGDDQTNLLLEVFESGLGKT